MRFSSKTFKRSTLKLSRIRFSNVASIREQKRRKTRRNLKALKKQKQQLKKQKGGAYGVEVPTNALVVNPLKTDIATSINQDI